MLKKGVAALRKRLCCLIIACIMLCLSLGALAEDTAADGYVMAGFDDTQYRDWDSNKFFSRMEEKTGVRFSYRQYKNESDWTAAKEAMLRGGDLPDVLFKAALSSSEMIEMREKGVLIDLKPYLESCCPNLWALFQAHPEYLDAISLPDGSVVALPYIVSIPMQNYMWINKQWLKNLGLSEPTTAEELVQVLEAFRDQDPNRNGKQDEIPFGFLGPFDLKFLAHAFGMVANDYNIFVRDGEVCFMPLEENYRLFVTWCRDLYEAGLLDQNGFTASSAARQVTDSNQPATYGVILAPLAADVFRVDWSTDYDILQPLVYDGAQVYRDFAGQVLRGTFAVTSACQDPEKMLRWVDYLYSEAGSVLASVGLENEDYLIDPDGTWRLSDATQNNPYFTVSYLIDGGATMPGIQSDGFQRRFSGTSALQETLDRQEKVNALCVRPFPVYSLTRAQADTAAALQEKIGYLVDMRLAQWVLGEEEISDESFQRFYNELEEAGLPQFLAFWQDILNGL